MTRKTFTLFDPTLVKPAIVDVVQEADPRVQWRNPVMFVVYVGSIITTALFVQALGGKGEAPAGFILAIALWLWFTVLFANFAEALAEGRSKAQAASLRSLKKKTWAKKLERAARTAPSGTRSKSTELRKGDVVLVMAGDVIPADGEVIEGVASVDESAITGESAPVIRESGGDFSAVTGGTRVLSDWIVVRVTVEPGRDLRRPHDRDGRERQAPEDAQRDRADDPAGRADHRVPGRHGDAAAVFAVQRRRRQGRLAGHA